ncbi:Exopolysaccharide production protein ExoY [Gammaproteobacteria bacterium]
MNIDKTSGGIPRIPTALLIVKHSLDWVLAACGVIVISPLFIILAIAIKIDDGGPIFFRQARIGRFAQQFLIWKFRTMIVDADRFLDERGRPTRERITRVGKVLRRYSLDEIPQLFNILSGQMSLVGPRPLLPERLPQLTDVQRERFAVRPGVTGLAQIAGRNTVLWSRRFELDCEYLRTLSLLGDLRIIWRTIGMVLTSRGIMLDRNPDMVDDLSAANNVDSVQNDRGETS